MRKAMAMTRSLVSAEHGCRVRGVRGKRLPTVSHWFRAANTDDSHF